MLKFKNTLIKYDFKRGKDCIFAQYYAALCNIFDLQNIWISKRSTSIRKLTKKNINLFSNKWDELRIYFPKNDSDHGFSPNLQKIWIKMIICSKFVLIRLWTYHRSVNLKENTFLSDEMFPFFILPICMQYMYLSHISHICTYGLCKFVHGLSLFIFDNDYWYS